MKKRGRPKNHGYRAMILQALTRNPGLSYYGLWKSVKGLGMTKGSYDRIVRELEKSGEIIRHETERTVKSVRFMLSIETTKNDLTPKLISQDSEGV